MVSGTAKNLIFSLFEEKVNYINRYGGSVMINQNSTNGNNLIPFLNTNLLNDFGVKLNDDQYEVYVNTTFVGHKSLNNQGENLKDIDDFLRKQGYKDFSSTLDGDHYIIQTIQENDIANALNVYFDNR